MSNQLIDNVSTGSEDSANCRVDELVQYIKLYVRKPLLLCGAISYFIPLYALTFYNWIFIHGATEYYEAGLATVIGTALLHALVLLFCYWSVHVMAFLNCSQVKTPFAGVLAKVVPTPNNGSSQLVVVKEIILENGHLHIYFIFQKVKYIWNESEARFCAVEFPINEIISSYDSSLGHGSTSSLTIAQQKFDSNQMEMIVPEFRELFIERATAPFFIFQLFSVGLWSLDDYWYYSFFTLFMLIIFECTLVKQQLRNMSEIRKMGNRPYALNVLRNNKWKQLISDQLVPGDVVSITRSQNDNLVPCDLILLRGSCIVDESMLTGESVPQMKESIEALQNKNKKLDIDGEDKLFVLFGGTKVVQHNTPSKDSLKAPDGGCIGYVLRTGFNTSQGKLLRTILFGVKRVTENSIETFAFILFLMIFAIAAASYVWIRGIENPDRNRYKLFLECTLILTIVIPPDLPIELSLAVNSSIIQLSKFHIFCTEPFRVPFAGKVQICCFDKTGTLTSDNLVVRGVDKANGKGILPMENADEDTIRVLACCHSLVLLEDGLVGDPLEKITLNTLSWNLTKSDTVIPKKGNLRPMRIYQRFYFASALKRMSVIAGYMLPYSNETCYIGAVKGAPEEIKKILKDVPEDYDKTYLEHTRRGERVLALGYKMFNNLDQQSLRALKRESVECDLIFCGFSVFHCPIKPDSKKAIKELMQGSNKIVMITGDNPLTACHVAKELRFVNKKALILTGQSENVNSNPIWKWISIDGLTTVDDTDFKILYNNYDLCVTGEGLQYLHDNHYKFMVKILPYVTVWARFAPKQKEYLVTKLQELGYYSLMCGDGTNDVGALKHAHVGVSLLSRSVVSEKKKKEKIGNVGDAIAPPIPRVTKSSFHETLRERNKQMLKEVEDDQVPIVKLGDASIAAPFTSKTSSITCVNHIIKQGRCTLVTTLQMFKILALNALISAYCQSVLYIEGVKLTDSQATLQGLLIAICFLSISRSKPLNVLSKIRPLPNIFNLYTICTILSQITVHFMALFYLKFEATARAPQSLKDVPIVLYSDLTPDDDKPVFEPNIINSTVFIICMALQICTFAVNYKGRPFMKSLIENRLLFYAILISTCLMFGLATGISSSLLFTFEVIDFPSDFRLIIIEVLIADVCGAYIVDKICAFLFGEQRQKSLE